MALFTSRHPEVELNFVEQEPEDAVQMLRAAELEVALVFEFRELSQPEFDRLYEGIELRHLIDDPMYLALPRDHPAARKPRVRLQDVAGDAGSRTTPPARAGGCTWPLAARPASSRRSASSRTTTTSSRA